MKVALAQLDSAQGDDAVARNLASAIDAIAEHAACDLVVFPELFLSGVSGARGYDDKRISLDGPEVARLSEAARQAASSVVIGAPIASESGTANAAIAIGPDGALTGAYAKTHLWDAERRTVASGPEIEVTAVGDLRAGLMICFDVEFPEVARALALERPDILITIAANMEPFGLDHATFVRARALENGLPHVYVNRVGNADGSVFVGASCAVDAGGRPLAQAGAEPCVLEVDVDPGRGREDSRLDYFGQRRPELYERLLDPSPAGAGAR